jgi:hypothetical protein
MSTKHTPGPWRQEETRVYFPNNAGGFCIRNCPSPEANARLIAAAPELLDIAETIALDSTSPHQWLDELRAAIAKATGEA